MPREVSSSIGRSRHSYNHVLLCSHRYIIVSFQINAELLTGPLSRQQSKLASVEWASNHIHGVEQRPVRGETDINYNGISRSDGTNCFGLFPALACLSPLQDSFLRLTGFWLARRAHDAVLHQGSILLTWFSQTVEDYSMRPPGGPPDFWQFGDAHHRIRSSIQ